MSPYLFFCDSHSDYSLLFEVPQLADQNDHRLSSSCPVLPRHPIMERLPSTTWALIAQWLHFSDKLLHLTHISRSFVALNPSSFSGEVVHVDKRQLLSLSSSASIRLLLSALSELVVDWVEWREAKPTSFRAVYPPARCLPFLHLPVSSSLLTLTRARSTFTGQHRATRPDQQVSTILRVSCLALACKCAPLCHIATARASLVSASPFPTRLNDTRRCQPGSSLPCTSCTH